MKCFSKITTPKLARICGVFQGTVSRALHNRAGINEDKIALESINYILGRRYTTKIEYTLIYSE